jgi:membrane protein CcdC involved in cytochrome C biogenesis
MKSGKSIIVVLILLLAIPILADVLISSLLPNETDKGKMSGMLAMGYLQHIPMFIIYLLIAFAIIFGIRYWKKGQNKKHE